MAPNPIPERTISRALDDPSLQCGNRLSHPLDPGDEVVISGIAGRYPESDNVYQLRDNLYNKVDMITDDDRRWNFEHHDIPKRSGKINSIDKFDADFFDMRSTATDSLDPQGRMLLEKAYECIVDAGVNPSDLRGTRTGVFVGSCYLESEKAWMYDEPQENGHAILGCSRCMLSNRISAWLGINGPSFAIDTACSSSMYALDTAYRAIREGHCEAALVGGTNLCLHPMITQQFCRLGVLSMDGACKSFDERGDGYARSETSSMIFLQKAKNAKRIYAHVVHTKTNCDGFKEQGITYPSGRIQEQLLREFYEECKVPVSNLAYLEAHGTGTVVGDVEEINALDNVFCKGRDEPLFIGSVKSNLGHSEPASGLCSIAKCCLAFEYDLIPPNLHFKKVRPDIPALVAGRLLVVADKTPLRGDFIGINSFGFGGANCHTLLRANKKRKVNNGSPGDDLPRLIAISGCTHDAITTMFTDLKNHPLDAEFVKLFHEVYKYQIPRHSFRGYILLKKGEMSGPAVSISSHVKYSSGLKRPVCLVFSGYGSEWAGIGAQLMTIPIFKAAIKRCDKVLSSKGINIIKIITSKSSKMFDNVVNSVTGAVAIQIGLVDVLRAVGVVPDIIIGHSIGELGCAYSDGCLTTEQTILVAYLRGLAMNNTEAVQQSTANVYLGQKQIKDICPLGIEVSCPNGPNSCTVMGPVEKMKDFVKSLRTKGISANENNDTSTQSELIAREGSNLLNSLKQVIPSPKVRTLQWLSSSIPEHLWNTESAKYSSAEYHTNNLLGPVLFNETYKLIPADAITIEIAPQGLLQKSFKKSGRTTGTNVALFEHGQDSVQSLLIALGKLFQIGENLDLGSIYPEVKFPVSRGTRMISPLITWDHKDSWFIVKFKNEIMKFGSGERNLSIDMSDDRAEMLAGHVIDGRHLYPATGYIMLVWETMAMMRKKIFTEVPVILENVKFHRATTVPVEGILEFNIMIQKGTGYFEVMESGGIVLTGRIYVPENVSLETAKLERPKNSPTGPDDMPMDTSDIYKELRLRGYNYSGLFKGILSANSTATIGRANWSNWISFMDCMLQMQILQEDTRGLFVPTEIERVIIDCVSHLKQVEVLPDKDKSMEILVYADVSIIKSGGIEIRGLKASAIGKKKALGEPVLESYQFVPNYSSVVEKISTAVRNNAQIILENVPDINVKVVEVLSGSSSYISGHIASALGDLPLIRGEVIVLAPADTVDPDTVPPTVTVVDQKLHTLNDCLIVVGTGILQNEETLNEAKMALKQNGFIISRESINFKPEGITNVQVITCQLCDNEEVLVMVQPTSKQNCSAVIEISEVDTEFQWLEQLKEIITREEKFIVYAQGQPTNGILGLVNCIRREPGGINAQCVFILDTDAPKFDEKSEFYKKQLDKNMAFNVLKNGTWGTFRHILLDTDSKVSAPHSYVNIGTRGDLSSLIWQQGSLTPNVHLKESEEIVQVYISALNFRDIMTATGKLAAEVIAKNRIEQDCVQGLEFAGRKSDGQRVVGMVVFGALSTMVMADKDLLWDVPDSWSLEDAATVPVVYCTSYYALYVNGKMKAGMNILIHAGSGGVGQAAITLALHCGCNVFTTVGTQEKRDFIKQRFPSLTDAHIGNSRNTSFEQLVMAGTKGRGVDLILNSLAEEKLQASLRCLAQGGIFLEIGKFDLANNAMMGLGTFLKETSFYGVMLDNLFTADRQTKKNIFKMLDDGIKSGAVKPLSRSVFADDEVEKAFRFMAAGKHVGKVLIRVREEEIDSKIAPGTCIIPATPKFYCNPDLTYVVCGGLGGFGLELADWLVLRGARKLLLTSRRGVTTGYQCYRIKLWRSYGTKILVSTADCTTQDGCDQTLKAASKLGPVTGIFNLAVQLRDALVGNQTDLMYKESFAPKAYSTKYLDISSRKLCPDLKHFVVFSSVSCGRGNAGQTNYGMSNSVMERICEQRTEQGLPGLAIQWGAVGDVGLVADKQETHEDVEIGGTLQQRIGSCLAVMDVFMSRSASVMASMVVAEKRALGAKGGTLVEVVANILGIRDLKKVSPQSTLAELGMDSMMAVEIKTGLEREFEVYLTPQEVRSLTFARLQELSDQKDTNGPVQSDKSQNALTGMEFMFATLGEESVALQPVIRLASEASGGSTVEDNSPALILLPGFEGAASVLAPLAINLSKQAICVQYDYVNSSCTAQEIATQILPHVKRRLPHGTDFNIVAYSFGTLVAIELTAILESEGRKGRLCIIDGAPDYLKALANVRSDISDDHILGLVIVTSVTDFLAPSQTHEVKQHLVKILEFKDKVQYLLKVLPAQTTYSIAYVTQMIYALFNRLKAVLAYENADVCLETPVTLIRPTEISISNMESDYGLSKYTKNKVNLHYFPGNHHTILGNKECAECINKLLS